MNLSSKPNRAGPRESEKEMKKLMFAATAAVCAAVTFGLESANIVGYQNTTPVNSSGYNFIIPTFVDVGANEAVYDLNNIKIVDGYGDGMTEMIIGYDDAACLSGVDYYWNSSVDTIMGPAEDCWVTEMMGETKATDVTVSLGTGLYLMLGTDGAKVQYAGQVYGSAVTVQNLVAGYNMVGNSTPVEIDLNDLKIVDGYGDGMTEMIIGYDAAACLSGVDYYWNTEVDTIMGPAEDCWVTEMMGDTKVEGVKLQPGEGVYLMLGTGGAKLTIPSAL